MSRIIPFWLIFRAIFRQLQSLKTASHCRLRGEELARRYISNGSCLALNTMDILSTVNQTQAVKKFQIKYIKETYLKINNKVLF